ncbi:unnamed protein product [marine sediment metagenome]|uniref:Uncharacterized protein n=1 Tax=marine sediment metagenome TaxID=412755 RepID=X1NRH5_9ZZZZ
MKKIYGVLLYALTVMIRLISVGQASRLSMKMDSICRTHKESGRINPTPTSNTNSISG